MKKYIVGLLLMLPAFAWAQAKFGSIELIEEGGALSCTSGVYGVWPDEGSSTVKVCADGATVTVATPLPTATPQPTPTPQSLGSLSDVDLATATPAADDHLAYDGASWVPATPAAGDGGGGAAPFFSCRAGEMALPASNFPNWDLRNNHRVLDFDASTDQCAYCEGMLSPDYAGGGLTVYLDFMMTSVESGAVGWLTRFERFESDGVDLDSDSFGTQKSVSATVAGTAGEPKRTTTAHTNGEIDGLLAGESFRLELCRDADGSVVTDDAAGTSEFMILAIGETP